MVEAKLAASTFGPRLDGLPMHQDFAENLISQLSPHTGNTGIRKNLMSAPQQLGSRAASILGKLDWIAKPLTALNYKLWRIKPIIRKFAQKRR
jgi:hypothetical protein